MLNVLAQRIFRLFLGLFKLRQTFRYAYLITNVCTYRSIIQTKNLKWHENLFHLQA